MSCPMLSKLELGLIHLLCSSLETQLIKPTMVLESSRRLMIWFSTISQCGNMSTEMFSYFSQVRISFECSKVSLCVCLEKSYWNIGVDYTFDSGFISSSDRGLLFLPPFGWKYFDGRNWIEEVSLKLTSKTC